MFAKEVIKLIVPRGLHYCKKIEALKKPLQEMDIDSFTYNITEDIGNGRQIRKTVLYSDIFLAETFLNVSSEFPENAFFENHKFPRQTSIYTWNDQEYIVKGTLYESLYHKIYTHNGIRNSIIFNFRDEFLKRNTTFLFLSHSENPMWLLQQIKNNKSLKKYILYLMENAPNVFNKELLTNQEKLNFLNKQPRANEIDSQSQILPNNTKAQMALDFAIRKYYLGYPFNHSVSKKEFEVLNLYFQGYATKNIAKNLRISPRTVDKHLENLRSKTNCKTLEALKIALFRCPLFLSLTIDL